MAGALVRRGEPQRVLRHSDQGSQYANEGFLRQHAEHGIACSMSRRGNGWDNAATESFFATLKTERTDRHRYRTRDAVRADVFNYIEQFLRQPMSAEGGRRKRTPAELGFA